MTENQKEVIGLEYVRTRPVSNAELLKELTKITHQMTMMNSDMNKMKEKIEVMESYGNEVKIKEITESREIEKKRKKDEKQRIKEEKKIEEEKALLKAQSRSTVKKEHQQIIKGRTEKKYHGFTLVNRRKKR
jgi:hypothetical protein